MTVTTNLSRLTGDYVIDPVRTRIGFAVRQSMVTTVRGRFDELEGELHLDGEDPARSSARLTIQARSLQTRNERRDRHVRAAFLATDSHPAITFASTRVEHHQPGTFVVTGDLTMHGTTRPVTVVFELTGAADDPSGALRADFEGRARIDRRDWGVVWNAVAEGGGAFVGNAVALELDVTAIRRA